MGFNLSRIKGQQGQPEALPDDEKLEDSEALKLRLAKENNAHERAMQKDKAGLCGKLFGVDKSAGDIAALIMVIVGCGLFIAVIFLMKDPPNREFWGNILEKIIAFIGIAAAYLFGKNAKD